MFGTFLGVFLPHILDQKKKLAGGTTRVKQYKKDVSKITNDFDWATDARN
jgi:hypothetical protein